VLSKLRFSRQRGYIAEYLAIRHPGDENPRKSVKKRGISFSRLGKAVLLPGA